MKHSKTQLYGAKANLDSIDNAVKNQLGASARSRKMTIENVVCFFSPHEDHRDHAAKQRSGAFDGPTDESRTISKYFLSIFPRINQSKVEVQKANEKISSPSFS